MKMELLECSEESVPRALEDLAHVSRATKDDIRRIVQARFPTISRELPADTLPQKKKWKEHIEEKTDAMIKLTERKTQNILPK